jgi:site-specific recombinase XerD
LDRRYVRFSGMRHPADLGAGEVRGFLAWLAERARESASTQGQALSALLFLYREVLGRDLGSIPIPRPAQPVRLPVVLDRSEIQALLGTLTGTPRVVALLLYGSGLRLLEALQLRVKDLDLAGRAIRDPARQGSQGQGYYPGRVRRTGAKSSAAASPSAAPARPCEWWWVRSASRGA